MHLPFTLSKSIKCITDVWHLFVGCEHQFFFRILENIALHKSDWQLYPYKYTKYRDYVKASNAVDGLKTDLSFAGHQCTHSANNKKEAMWRVDLRAILGIDSITIYYKTENAPWGRHTDFYLMCLLEE